MIKLLFLIWSLPAFCFAQIDSVKTKPHDIFCRLYAVSGRGLFPKPYFKADFGIESSLKYLTNSETNKVNEKLATCHDEIDALDYLSEQGWKLFDTNSQRDQPLVYLLRKEVF